MTTRAWQVPPKKTKGGNWYEIPMWMAKAGAVPVPRHHYTLSDGRVAKPEQWISEDGAGGLLVTDAAPSGCEVVPLRMM